MNITQELHDLGQSLWLDNLSRELTTSGTLARYIRDMSLTGHLEPNDLRQSDRQDSALRRDDSRCGGSGPIR